jgi:hypothetical protein
MSDEDLARERADWLVDAIATATQNRSFLRGDPEEDEVATEAILLNGHKAIAVAIAAVRAEERAAKEAEIERLRERVAVAGRVLRGAWVIEDRKEGVCVVATDDEGVPFRFAVNQVVAPYWKRWEAERRGALSEMGKK